MVFRIQRFRVYIVRTVQCSKQQLQLQLIFREKTEIDAQQCSHEI